jgi:hypothetical protein
MALLELWWLLLRRHARSRLLRPTFSRQPIPITRTKRDARTYDRPHSKINFNHFLLFLFLFLVFGRSWFEISPPYCGATKRQTETLRLLVQYQADLSSCGSCGSASSSSSSSRASQADRWSLAGLTWSTTTAAVHCTSPPSIATWKCAR